MDGTTLPAIVASVTVKVDGAHIAGYALSDGTFRFLMSDRAGFGPSKDQSYKSIPDAVHAWRESRPMEVA